MAALVLLIAHLLLVAWLTLRPVPVIWVSPANLHPLATIESHIEYGPRPAARCIGGGLLLLAPLGLLLPLLWGHTGSARLVSWTRTAFTAAMLSVGIELLQSGVPGHVPDVDTVLLNTIGVGLVHLLLYPSLGRWVSRRSVRWAQATPSEAASRLSAATAPGRGGDAARGRASRAHRVGIAP